EAIRDSGRRNYSLFLRADGLLIGYYEADDDTASQAALARDPRTAKWEERMSPFFIGAGDRPDQNAVVLEEVFNLEDQLTTARSRQHYGVPMSSFTPAISDGLAAQEIELPSWAFGNSGTRFRVFGTPGTPRDPFEKISDAAQAHKYTGLAPQVALHIPWDEVDSYSQLREHAEDNGMRLGTINSNTFQAEEYKFGSLTHHDAATRQKAIDHHLRCIEIMNETGSRDLKIWLADGSNYPGQADLRGRQDRLFESLQTIYAQLSGDQRLVLGYMFFVPAFYLSDVRVWGTAFAHSAALGKSASVCLVSGHRGPGTYIEFFVMQLLRVGKL